MKTYDDSRIDTLIWQAIAESDCPEDFRHYLRHKPEGAAHLEEAMERLIALDDTDAEGRPRYPEAVAAIRALAGQGDATAQFHMGKLHGLGWYDDGPQAMEKWYRLAILQNEARSMINLANACEQGTDVEKNADAALALYRTAAELGEPMAHTRLASLHLAGETIEKDAAQAYEHLLQGWEAGDATAGYWLSVLHARGDAVARDKALAADWLRQAAERGCDEAAMRLGRKAEFGGDGAARDIAAAEAWYRLGAERGDPECQTSLGILLLRGEGIPKNGAEAVRWLKRAAVLDYPPAQHALGMAYHWGVDVVRNKAFARKWLSRAAGQGDADACLLLADMLRGDNTPDRESAVRQYEKAARQGRAEAQSRLGLAYWKGEGIARDEHAAFKWIRLAALQNEPRGLFLLGWAC
ncbi:MAG: SEL1-like repeat protein [Rhodocyclales bacterium]|nr:SEL1-like repeat protein [Rhodocyclales bacterium]